jgi:hypothetical protein
MGRDRLSSFPLLVAVLAVNLALARLAIQGGGPEGGRQRFTLESLTVEEKGDWLTALLEASEPGKSMRAVCLSPFSGRIASVNRCSSESSQPCSAR